MLVAAVGTLADSACHQDQAPALALAPSWPLRRKPSCSDDSSSKLAAAPRCEAEADSRCVLVSAAGTLVESACHQDRATMHVLPLQRQPP